MGRIRLLLAPCAHSTARPQFTTVKALVGYLYVNPFDASDRMGASRAFTLREPCSRGTSCVRQRLDPFAEPMVWVLVSRGRWADS